MIGFVDLAFDHLTGVSTAMPPISFFRSFTAFLRSLRNIGLGCRTDGRGLAAGFVEDVSSRFWARTVASRSSESRSALMLCR